MNAATPAGTGADDFQDDQSLDLGASLGEDCPQRVRRNRESLTPAHAALLQAAAIPLEKAVTWGIRSVTRVEDLPPAAAQFGAAAVPGLLFPWTSPSGERVEQYRPDNPVGEGEAGLRKYLWPAGQPLVINVIDPNPDARTLFIVEGTKQALAAAAYGPAQVQVVGIAGCWGWSRDGFINPDLAGLVENRVVVIAFDADFQSNHQVWTAAHDLGRNLALVGATEVRYAGVPGGGSRGLDDFLGVLPDPRQRYGFVARLLDNAPSRMPKPPAVRRAPPARDPGDPRPTIDVSRDRLVVIRDVVDVLVQRWDGWRLFDFGEVISELDGHETRALDRGRFRNVLAETASFVRPGAGGSIVQTWPDGGVLEAVIASYLRFQPLQRVSRAPFIRDDGTICLEPGYDPGSSTVLVPAEDLDDLDLPQNPTPEQVTAAVSLILEDWLGDMPFATSADRANALALVLTPFVRGLVRLVPLAVVDGLQMGVGKNLLADCLSIMVSGGEADPLPFPGDDEELRKVITSTFGTGANMFVFDEAHVIDGRSLSRALTATSWEDRILGVSRMANYPNRITWIALGNNVQVRGDLVRRVYRIAMHPSAPNPETRPAGSFRHPDLRAWTRDHRAALIRAALTLVRAWYAAGQPTIPRGVSFGSFEEWDQMMGGILHLAAVGGFLQNGQQWRGESDFDTVHWADHLEDLDDVFEGRPFTTADVRAGLGQGVITESPPGMEDPTPIGYSRELGKAYARIKGRWFGNRRILLAGTPGAGGARGSVNRWRVERGAEGSEGSGGSPPGTARTVTGPAAEPGLTELDHPADRPHPPDPSDPCPVTVVHLETCAPDEMFTGRHEGPFLRLLAWQEPDKMAHTSTDPALMRQLLDQAPALLTYNGLAGDLVAVAHHLQLDYARLAAKTRDLLLEARLADPPANPGEHCHDLDALAARHVTADAGPDLKRRLKTQFHGYDHIPLDDPRYAASALRELTLTGSLAEAITAPDATYAKREHTIATIAGSMTLTGLRVDVDMLTSRRLSRSARLDQLRDRLIGEYRFPVTDTSGMRPAKRPWATKTGGERFLAVAEPVQWPLNRDGSPVLRADQLRYALDVYPGSRLAEVCGLILESQFGNAFLDQLAHNLLDDRVHPVYGMGTTTGRWTAARPNILGVGKRTTELLADRDLILAEPGCVFIGVDLSGIDARCVAGLSGDVRYAAMFANGVDIHAEMAELFLGDRTRREEAKAISHGINYGRSPRAIAQQTGRPLDEVSRMHQAYFDRFAGIAFWHHEIRQRGAAGAVLPTGTGRGVRVTPDNAHTEAPGRLAQAAARDLAATGLLNLADAGLLPMLRLFIHDEVILSVPEQDADVVSAHVAQLMTFDWESPSGLIIPIVAAPSKAHGPRWSDVHDDARR